MGPEFKCGDFILKLETQNPCESVQRKALLELRETPQNVEKGLNELKILLQAEKDLITPIDNEEWLLMFLRTCKFYPESARDLIKGYYDLQRKYASLRPLLFPSQVKKVFDAKLVSILPQRDQHGRRIIVQFGSKQKHYKNISMDDIFASSAICTYILQKEPETQINGIVYIMDMEDFSYGTIVNYSTYIIKRFMDFMQNYPSFRIKGFHIVNQPNIFHYIFAIIKSFLNPKFSKRIIMHGTNYESLHRYISPERLPTCYGGKLTMDLMYSDETYQLLAHNESFFEDFRKYGYKTQ